MTEETLHKWAALIGLTEDELLADLEKLGTVTRPPWVEIYPRTLRRCHAVTRFDKLSN